MYADSATSKLMQAFGFGTEELYANRQGMLTAKQQEMVTIARQSLGCGSRFAAFAVIGSMALIAVVLLLSMDINSEAFGQILPYYVILFIFFLVPYIIATIIGRFRARDLREGRIRVAEGTTQLWTKTIGRVGTAYFLRIGDIRFQVPTEEKFATFNQFSSYRIYYIKYPPAHIILSIESW